MQTKNKAAHLTGYSVSTVVPFLFAIKNKQKKQLKTNGGSK
jgi:hypothetical protein